MLQIAQIINSTLFLAISGLHFYWALASLFGKKTNSPSAVLPEIAGKSAIMPSAFITFIVALGLLFFAIISGFDLVQNQLSQQFGLIFIWGNLVISILFLIRAIGDFKYVGFTKKIKGTKFAKYDNQYYSPLCLLISVVAFIIYWNMK